MTIGVQMREMVRVLRRREKEMVATLRRFVECESPSADKAAVDRFGEMVAREWRRRGAAVRTIRQRERGNHVRAEIAPRSGGTSRQLLILGHLDTVYPIGTLRAMPFHVSRGRAFGPGTFDMKGGLVLALFAVDAMREVGVKPAKRLVFFWDSDEEIGSGTSRKLIEAEARRSDAVLVLEPSLGPRGDLKTQRKGVGTAEIIVRGRAAHAGIDPGAGVNAVHELALQIERLMKMNDRARGITVQATV
ncbi:MAG TPA: M20/M25/M40 family metallo-hydrolase, partial [Candidatus Acidoferrales bacterium]|nr:M20/M25/M40 family metallo-hydrolase [Candidatus Acidoferrales bacterium]